MRSRMRWGAAFALGVALLGMAAVAGAQQPVTLPMAVTENRAPGAAGQVTMTPLGNNQVRVDIRITGLPANEQRAAHVHTREGAACDNGAPVTYPLTNVAVDGAGVGTSTTTITVTADRPIQANNAYVNVHQTATGGPGVICANITQTFAAGAAAAGTGQAGAGGATALPRTGTGGLKADSGANWMLAGVAAFALLLGGTGALAAARRRK